MGSITPRVRSVSRRVGFTRLIFTILNIIKVAVQSRGGAANNGRQMRCIDDNHTSYGYGCVPGV